MNRLGPEVVVQEFGTGAVRKLLASAIEAIQRAAKSPDEKAVHRMRVSIRRLQQALRLFGEFYPKRGVKQVRAELKSIMEPAGELRNYDIAQPLVRVHLPEFAARRIAARECLLEAVGRVAGQELGKRWRGLLGMEADEETVEG